MLSGLPGLDLTLLEPESNLLLGVLDAVGAVADVAADIDGEVTTDWRELRISICRFAVQGRGKA